MKDLEKLLEALQQIATGEIVGESKNSDEFLNNVLIASSNLISEGYEINEIEDYH